MQWAGLLLRMLAPTWHRQCKAQGAQASPVCVGGASWRYQETPHFTSAPTLLHLLPARFQDLCTEKSAQVSSLGKPSGLVARL